MEEQDELKKQVADIQAKLKAKDEEARKTMESAFREKMSKDTAGTVMEMFQVTQAQIASLQQQIDQSSPIPALVRGLNAIAQRQGTLEAWIETILPQISKLQSGGKSV
jgi:chromosome segregation ATPase